MPRWLATNPNIETAFVVIKRWFVLHAAARLASQALRIGSGEAKTGRSFKSCVCLETLHVETATRDIATIFPRYVVCNDTSLL